MNKTFTLMIMLSFLTMAALCQNLSIVEKEKEFLFPNGKGIIKEDGVRYYIQTPFLFADYYKGYSDGRALFEYEKIYNSEGDLIIEHSEQTPDLSQSSNGKYFVLYCESCEHPSKYLYLLNDKQEIIKKLEYGMYARVKFSPDNQQLLLLNDEGDDIIIYDFKARQ